jgi:hypothetical protein
VVKHRQLEHPVEQGGYLDWTSCSFRALVWSADLFLPSLARCRACLGDRAVSVAATTGETNMNPAIAAIQDYSLARVRERFNCKERDAVENGGSDGIIILGRRDLVRTGAAAAFSGKPRQDEHSDLALAIWPRWQIALRRLDDLNEDQRTIGIEERELGALTDLLLNSDVRTMAGLIVKLQALLQLAPSKCGDANDYPWPEIRTIIGSCRINPSL